MSVGHWLTLATALALAPQALAHEQRPEAVDTEHIFGFTEGTDIGEKGELELENSTVGSFGRQGGFAAVTNELAARYGIENGFRAAAGVLTDYHDIHASPGLDDVSSLDFSGISSEFRWAALKREAAPFGLTLSFAPFWRRLDATSGARLENVNLPVTLLADKAFLPDTLFGAVNVTYEPTFSRIPAAWRTEHNVEVSAAATYAIADGVFLGAEIRRDFRYATGVLPAHGLFVGPSLFVKLSESMSVKVAWSAQISGLGSSRVNLTDYERHQVLLLLVKSF